MKKILGSFYKILYKTGYSLLVLFVMLFISLTIITLKMATEKTSNPFCELNEQPTIKINDDKIDNYSYKYNCNTLEIDIYLKDETTKEEALALLIEVKADLEANNVVRFGQVLVVGKQLPNCLYVNLNLHDEGISVVS